MHSHERTMLARFGFADADRKESDHDLACRYLAEKWRVIVDLLYKRNLRTEQMSDTMEYNRIKESFRFDETEWKPTCETLIEDPISKGQGQYKTTIGFVDLVINGQCSVLCRGTLVKFSYKYVPDVEVKPKWPGDEPRKMIVEESEEAFEMWRHERDIHVCVEVKIQEISAAEIIRQINLYREYLTYHKWVVATRFPMTPHYAQALRDSHIVPMVLGTSFDAWKDTIKEFNETHEKPITI